MIRAEIADRTVKTPHGLSYAVILQDQQGTRILGFDNSHDFDGAQDDDPYDHEHKAGRVGQRFRYRFKSPSVLVRDFFDRCEMYCERVGVPFEFVEDVV
ncbi:toxin-antitoxin system TumE family protein [Arenibaculum sp.]|uniref:toxin-antitoxin system TumE family protein n=1 Tax=Arenibaculum sp. TaxID=2865862 RepID=UPI002E0F4048|nr:DUF6516 family protein [Arenibaculum sp.]